MAAHRPEETPQMEHRLCGQEQGCGPLGSQVPQRLPLSKAAGAGGGGSQKQSFYAVPRPLLQTKIENSLKSTLWPPRWASCGRQWT